MKPTWMKLCLAIEVIAAICAIIISINKLVSIFENRK
jgi:hypothetical protein